MNAYVELYALNAVLHGASEPDQGIFGAEEAPAVADYQCLACASVSLRECGDDVASWHASVEWCRDACVLIAPRLFHLTGQFIL